MKKWIWFLIGINLYGADLIQVANDASSQQLQALSQKYQQPLLISDEKVYLIPSSCRLDRYFGGASQGGLTLVQAPSYTEAIPMTQEVFEAKETTQIVKKIEQEKSIAIAEAKTSRAFLEDKEGRGFGGASQIPLDFSFEKVQLLQEAASAKHTITIQDKPAKSASIPQCEMLEDGSGYRLKFTTHPSFYRHGTMESVMNNMVRYE